MDYYKDTESWEDAADLLGTKEVANSSSFLQPRDPVTSFISGSPSCLSVECCLTNNCNNNRVWNITQFVCLEYMRSWVFNPQHHKI